MLLFIEGRTNKEEEKERRKLGIEQVIFFRVCFCLVSFLACLNLPFFPRSFVSPLSLLFPFHSYLFYLLPFSHFPVHIFRT
jgi:hypothetical protein